MNDLTYRAVLDGETYMLIVFYKWHIFLRKVNKRPVRCGECQQEFLPAQCVYHGEYRNNHFICIACAKTLILRHAPKGFHVNPLFNIQAANMMTGKYTARQVADSLQLFHVKQDANGLDILTPFGEEHG